MFWSAYTYGHHYPLILACKQTIDQKTTKKDQLSINTTQYCHEILKSNLASFIKATEASDEEYLAVEDGHPAPTSKKGALYSLQLGIRKIT